jgi:ribonucleoside-triphosphate reductase
MKETTDLTLFIRTSNEEIVGWDRRRIVDALILETDVDVATAEEISREVETQILSSGIKILTTPLVREMVDAKLVERGLEQARRMHTRLGFPLYDVGQLMLHQNKENANLPHGPEGTNLILAEGIKRDYALHSVFSQDVSDAHIRGDIHLHGLGCVDRPYSSFQSVEFIKKFGLCLPDSFSISKPARHAEVLLAHLVRWSASLQGYFAASIGWEAVNVSFAPYLKGLGSRDIEQLAQMLLFEFSQLAVARGGQSIFTEIGLYWDIPGHLAGLPALGPEGNPTGKTYGDYGREARRFLRAIFENYRQGDAVGRPFFFPKPFVHITDGFFKSPGHRDFLHLACETALEKGNPCFIFDRGPSLKIPGCFRASLDADDEIAADIREPERMRYATIQNVSLNLPRLGYRADGKESRLLELMSETLEIAARAHLQKKVFIERLLSHGESGPLSILTMTRDGMPYLRMDRATFLIGMVGLNELVQIAAGAQLHESRKARETGLRIVRHMKEEAERLGRRQGMRFVLEQTPAESTAYRFARLDLRYFSPASGHFVKGDISKGEIYYNNSTFYNIAAPMNPFERVKQEGLFHPWIDGHAATQLWIGDPGPSKEQLSDFVKKVFRETRSDAVSFSPHFSFCAPCGRTFKGLSAACPACGSTRVEGITRISGYFTHVSRLNRGKIAELRDTGRTPPHF